MLYDKIGQGYNTTRQADPYIANRLYELLTPEPLGRYLDIGCGTGNYTIELAERGLRMYGVEPSAQMLNEARNKSNQVQWLSGTAESIPIASDSLDGAIATLTIHHWHDLERAFQELGRVVKAGGDLVFFTAAPEQMAGYWLNHYFPEMLAKSIRQMPKLPELATKLAKAGFAICQTEPYSIRDDLKDFFLYAGKNKPELYLHDEMRKGISAFATLANQAEVNAGLAALRSDYERGKWQAIQHQYANQDGDYLFLVAQKRS